MPRLVQSAHDAGDDGPSSIVMVDVTWTIAARYGQPGAAWQLRHIGFHPALEHEVESRFALSNGLIGIRASLEQPTPASRPRTYVAGVFDLPDEPFAIPSLVIAPQLDGFELSIDGEAFRVDQAAVRSLVRELDLRHGWVRGAVEFVDRAGRPGRIETLRFVSQANRPLAMLVAKITAPPSLQVELCASIENTWSTVTPVQASPPARLWASTTGRRHLATSSHATLTFTTDSGIEPASTDQAERWTWHTDAARDADLTCIRVVARDWDHCEPMALATEQLQDLCERGIEGILDDHVLAWRERWRSSDIVIEGDPAADRALRFAIYHLNSAANPDDERVSIGARALTGDGYRGHVFWDTEIFVLPFYILTWPQAARALLMYRYHTLPAARAKANQLGYRGALYAWESADTGHETTPPFVIGPDGAMIPILCGTLEQHISADIAFAVWHYWRATGDAEFLRDAGAEIILETARFWQSRFQLGDDGLVHIPNVIGPDEYHEGVDDNAFTNVMAQWNLERGVEVARIVAERWPDQWHALETRLDLSQDEVDRWRDTAARVYQGFDSNTALFEQFQGYHQLATVNLDDFEPRTVPMDVILGREETQRSQVIKQADVVMMLALLGDALPVSVQVANFDYYEPRCGHGSSLSPSMHALVAARLKKTELAKRYFDQSACLDLEDTMGNAAHGVHIAAMGGTWQAMVFGFAGFRADDDGIWFDPSLPGDWRAVRFPLQWRGRHVKIEIEQDTGQFSVTLEAGEPLCVGLQQSMAWLRQGETTTWSLTDASDPPRSTSP
jgi:trehalose/maltose hydrolase-like predicted phosphorylase